MPSNQAAYLDAQAASLIVRDAPYTSPPPSTVVIKVRAAALNPADVGMWQLGLFIKKYPYILGCDISGIIEEVASDVSNFKPGDRVYAMSAPKMSILDDGSFAMATEPGPGGFQLYSVANVAAVAKIPDNVSFEEGSVMPLCTTTAMHGLYQPSLLGLEFPSLQPKEKDGYVLIWSGATTVGSCAIQLARCSGYKVITTSSAHNFAYCEGLGAEKLFDYKKDDVVDEIVEFLKGKQLVGTLDSWGRDGTLDKCVPVVQRAEGSKNLTTVIPGAEKQQFEGVKIAGVGPGLDKDYPQSVLLDFVPKALEQGVIKAKPEPLVVGNGLEYAQKALDTLKAGISAKKVVVTL